ncbi:sensor histidine kinase [Streptomyces sp. H39-S7]|uniref:sensor histidine kinase n=1 Tax=Streptomyces sp. H39-S7 TaxID=3004357 RepID=UPI0022B00142|nr:nitrate- and nitrite sensing domain-containing protein [Streptomyces sp. H39-S7]MCZ4120453.1 nitrate- and nitrite sensing domain-containing protein [Streptomyces sp. H39-S7]
MVPVVSLMALWAFAAVNAAQDVSGRLRTQQVEQELSGPVAVSVTALQAERRAAALYLAAPTTARAAQLDSAAAATDRAAGALRQGSTHTIADGIGLPPDVAPRLRTFLDGVTGLRALRARVTARGAGWDETYRGYCDAVENAFSAIGVLTAGSDPVLTSGSRVALEFGRAGEMLAREDALLSVAQLTGTLDGPRYRDFTGAVQTRRLLLAASAHDLEGRSRAAWEKLAGSAPYGTVLGVEDGVLRADPGPRAAAAAPASTWTAASEAVIGGLHAIDIPAGGSAATGSSGTDPVLGGLMSTSGAAVLLGLLAVVVSLIVSVRIGRALVTELVELRNSALELARRKLPSAMRRLRAGEEIDLDAEAPQGTHGADEIGQVGEALRTVHRAALTAAVERAELLSGVTGVFVNLARRSQVLVHRQLALLDSMERRTEDPGELEDLFRLDHLTTRMRRHAEGLIILSGAAPGRAWRRPVLLQNVVRAAVAEVEDYARVEVRGLPQAAVIGGAVADLTHLIAELVENATQFSPPHTKVRISGEQVGNGYVLEVEDRGLGMGGGVLDEANRRIARAQALDLFDSDRLGLFVVSRLSARHDVRVSLRPSPYGGTTAVVLLPTALMERYVPDPAPARRAAERNRAQRAHREDPVVVRPLAAAGRASAASPAGPPRPGQPAAEPPGAAGPGTNGTAGPPANAAPDPRTNGTAGPRANGAGGPRASGASGPAANATPGGGDDLPRRVRKAHLAPQLLERPAPDRSSPLPGNGPDDESQDAGGRTPEQIRAIMTAYRGGWARGGGRPAGRPASNEGDPA